MEQKQITLNAMYSELKKLESLLQDKGIIKQSEIPQSNDLIWDWPENIPFFADEDLLAEDWLSPEDEEAWKDL